MRISDLSRQTGVPVATIKFYLRERLLPPGTPTCRNQAVYDETHLRRLLLIRAFTTIARLDLSSVRALLGAIEDERLSLPRLYEVADRALFAKEPSPGGTGGVEEAQADVDGFLADIGWRVDPEAPGRTRLAQVLAALRLLGCECGIDFFAPYASAAEHLAEHELDLLPPDAAEADRAAAVVRSVLLGVALGAMRRMAQEHVVGLRFGHQRHPAPST